MILTEYAKSRGNVDVDPQALDKLLGIKLPGRWKPQVGETYWFITDRGDVAFDEWTNHEMDEYRYKMGNVFRAESDTEFERERREVIAELENYAEEHNEYTPDWKNGEQGKWLIYYDYACERLDVKCEVLCKSLRDGYFTSKGIALAAIESVGADRIKKYVCRVVDYAMDAKKCDRCGEYYDIDETIQSGRPDVLKISGEGILSIYHLCKSCMGVIVDYLESGDES